MADLINVRPRPGVRINLHPADIANIMQQEEVLSALNTEELKTIAASCLQELKQRPDHAGNNT